MIEFTAVFGCASQTIISYWLTNVFFLASCYCCIIITHKSTQLSLASTNESDISYHYHKLSFSHLFLGNVMDPVKIIEGGGDQKLQPAYGADTLRLWVSGVDYTGE